METTNKEIENIKTIINLNYKECRMNTMKPIKVEI